MTDSLDMIKLGAGAGLMRRGVGAGWRGTKALGGAALKALGLWFGATGVYAGGRAMSEGAEKALEGDVYGGAKQYAGGAGSTLLNAGMMGGVDLVTPTLDKLRLGNKAVAAGRLAAKSKDLAGQHAALVARAGIPGAGAAQLGSKTYAVSRRLAEANEKLRAAGGYGALRRGISGARSIGGLGSEIALWGVAEDYANPEAAAQGTPLPPSQSYANITSNIPKAVTRPQTFIPAAQRAYASQTGV